TDAFILAEASFADFSFIQKFNEYSPNGIQLNPSFHAAYSLLSHTEYQVNFSAFLYAMLFFVAV
ncbi:MAG TPA: hypothetical protein DHM90_08920, partial [Clostridiaceae bacterium]|nr:hypothetical protein [Clostridiaceae bacterium]